MHSKKLLTLKAPDIKLPHRPVLCHFDVFAFHVYIN